MSCTTSTCVLEMEVGNCQFCLATDTVDIHEQTDKDLYFGLISLKPVVHRMAQCRSCTKSIKEEYYTGRTKPPMALAATEDATSAES